MPGPSERQLLADAIRGELLQAHHGAADIDELVERVLDCIDAHRNAPWTASGGYVVHADGTRIEMPVGVADDSDDCHERARRTAAALNGR